MRMRVPGPRAIMGTMRAEMRAIIGRRGRRRCRIEVPVLEVTPMRRIAVMIAVIMMTMAVIDDDDRINISLSRKCTKKRHCHCKA